jgi:hypothetical protein
MKKGVGSGFISKRYGSGEPDPHQNVKYPKNSLKVVTNENWRGGGGDGKCSFIRIEVIEVILFRKLQARNKQTNENTKKIKST